MAAQLSDWANALSKEAKYEAAESAARTALAIRRRHFGSDDSTLAASLRTLGGIATRRGSNDSAEAFYREALAIDRRLYGDDHLVVAEDLGGLGVVLENVGRLRASDSASSAALAIRRHRLDPGHPALILTLHNLAAIRHRLGDYEESERLKREVLEQRRKLYPKGHPDVAAALKELGSLLSERARGMSDRRRFEEAESLFIQARVMQQALLGRTHPETMLTLHDLAVLRYWKGDLSAAERDMRAVYDHLRNTLGEDHQETVNALTNLGAIIRDQGKYPEAELLLRRA